MNEEQRATPASDQDHGASRRPRPHPPEGATRASDTPAARTQKVVRRLERHIGGKLLSIEPQARWRPVWFAEIERPGTASPGTPRRKTATRRGTGTGPVADIAADTGDGGERLSLCVRGDRIDPRHGFPLEHEMKLQRLLQERGIPVPRVWGWLDDPRPRPRPRAAERKRPCPTTCTSASRSTAPSPP